MISGVVTFNGSATTATNAGSYTITPGVSALSAANYTFKPVNGTLQITKAQLTVKADNKAKPFDGLPFTAFTSTITGYVNGENSSVVSGSVTYAGNAVGATAVGTYTITPGTGGLTATNYSFTGANGTLTISAWYATGFYDPIGVDSSQFVASGVAVPTVCGHVRDVRRQALDISQVWRCDLRALYGIDRCVLGDSARNHSQKRSCVPPTLSTPAL